MRGMTTWLGALAMLSLPFAAAGAAPVGRGYVGGHFALELDGVQAGFLQSAQGGALSAEVIEFQSGDSLVVKKQIGKPKYEDFSILAGFNMSPAFYDWISAMLRREVSRKDGAIVQADFNLRARSRLEFHEALLTEVGFPALDAAAKDPAYLALRISPETLEYVPQDGGKSVQGDAKAQKQWLPSNFRFTLGDLPTKRVTKIDAFTVKQKILEASVGGFRDVVRIPGKLEIPNLRITFAQSDIQPWLDWYQEFVVEGRSSDEDELDGSIQFLDPKGGAFATLELSHVGIFRVETLTSSPPDAVQRATVELYCEEMEFKTGLVPK